MAGYIRISRSLLDWEWYDDANTFRVFMHLLLNASYEDKKYHGIDVRKGSLVTGRHQLAEELGISERNVRTALNHLKSTNEVTIKVTSKYSIITLCKFESWQCLEAQGDQQTDQQSDQQPTNNRPASDQQPTTTKEIKEIKKEINKENNILPPSPPQGETNGTDISALMDEIKALREKVNEMRDGRSKRFVPPTEEEVADYIRQKGYHFEAGKFIAFYESKGWMIGKNKMKDWKAACRTWEGSRSPNGNQGVEDKYRKFYETHTPEEEARIYRIDANFFRGCTEEQKNYWRRERIGLLEKYLEEHVV